MSAPGRIENYYGCCDRPPTFTVGAGSDRCPEHGGEAFSRWVPSRAEPAAGPSEAIPEIERLKAENASLLESLREAKKQGDGLDRLTRYMSQVDEATQARAAAEEERDELRISLNEAERAAAAVEQRAEAAEKALRAFVASVETYYTPNGEAPRLHGCPMCDPLNPWNDEDTDETGPTREQFTHWPTCKIGKLKVAALHDEERRQDGCPGFGVTKEQLDKALADGEKDREAMEAEHAKQRPPGRKW